MLIILKKVLSNKKTHWKCSSLYTNPKAQNIHGETQNQLTTGFFCLRSPFKDVQFKQKHHRTRVFDESTTNLFVYIYIYVYIEFAMIQCKRYQAVNIFLCIAVLSLITLIIHEFTSTLVLGFQTRWSLYIFRPHNPIVSERTFSLHFQITFTGSNQGEYRLKA